MESSIYSLEHVISISEKVRDFFSTKKLRLFTSDIARLAIKEMAGNILRHAFKEWKHVNIKIVEWNNSMRKQKI